MHVIVTRRLYVDTSRVGTRTFYAIAVAPGAVASEVSQLVIKVPRCEAPELKFDGSAVSINPLGNTTVYYRWNAAPVPPKNPPGEEVFGFAATTDDSTVEYVPGTPVLFDAKSPDDKTLCAIAVRPGSANSILASCAIEVARAPAPKIMFKNGKVYLRSDVPGSSVHFRADKSELWTRSNTIQISGKGEHTVYATAHAAGLAESTVVNTKFTLDQLAGPAVSFDGGMVTMTHTDANAKLYYSWNAPPAQVAPASKQLPRGTEEYFVGQRIVMKAGANSDVLHVIAQAAGKLTSEVVTVSAVQAGGGAKGLIRTVPGLTSVAIPVVLILKKGAAPTQVPECGAPNLEYANGKISVSSSTGDAQVFYDWYGDPEIPTLLPRAPGSGNDDAFGFGQDMFGPASGFTVPVELDEPGQRELRCIAAKKGFRQSTVALLTIQIREVAQPSVRKAWDSNKLLITCATPECQIYFTTGGAEPTETPDCLLDKDSMPAIPWATDDDYEDDFVLKVFARKHGEIPSATTTFKGEKPWQDVDAPEVSLEAIKDGSHVYVPKPKKPPTPEPEPVVEDEEEFAGFGDDAESVAEPPQAKPAYVNPVTLGSTSKAKPFAAAAEDDEENTGFGDDAPSEPQLLDKISDDGKTREVQIDKGDGKLGIGLLGTVKADDKRVGVFVTDIKDESPLKGIFEPKIRLHSIDGNDCTTASKMDVVKLMQKTGQIITFVISNGPDVAAYDAFENAAPKKPEPKKEEPKAEEPKKEEPKKEEPKAEEPKAEEPKAEEPKAEEPKAEEPKAEEPKAEEPKAEAPEQAKGKKKGSKKNKSKKGKVYTEADIGKMVQVEGYNSQGTIRFVGPHHENGSARVGVELESPEAKSDGKFKGHQYFKCPKKKGVLVAPTKIKVVVEVSIGAPIQESPEDQSASPAPAEPKEEAAEKAPEPAASSGASAFDGMSRLQLIKECRARDIDYKPAGKDVEAIKALLVAADGNGGGDAAPLVAEEPKDDAAEPKKPQKKASKKGGKITEANVGDACSVADFDCGGTIRFVGPHHETGKERIGVQLDEPLGKSAGKFKGHEYFKCPKKCAVLVLPSKVTLR